MKKFILILAVFIAGLAYFYINFPFKKSDQLILYGNVDIRQVNTAFRVSGRLLKMNFEEGDPVHQGDILATLDPQPLINAKNQAQAKVQQAAAAADNAARTNKRKQSLCQTKNASQQDCDTAQANEDIAKADLAYAHASLDVAQTALDDTTLQSPAEGVVLIRIAEPGTLLSAGVPVYTISLNKKMWVRAYIQETDLGKVKIGSEVIISTDSDRKQYHGHIGFISPTAEFTPKSIETSSLRTDLVYRLRIIIDDADDYLKQGMPVTIQVMTK